MAESSPMPPPADVPALAPDDAKLVVLARSSMGRTGAAEGAAVRDLDGRTYAASTVDLPSLQLSALQAAVAAAVSSGAEGVEAAAVVTGADRIDENGARAVRDLSPTAALLLADRSGAVQKVSGA